MNPYKNALKQLDNIVVDLSKLYEDKAVFAKAIKQLQKPQRFIAKTITVKGKSYKAYRSQHNDALGPFKGGIRFHPNVTKEEVMALSMWMSWKTSLMGIPFGGGKGGVAVDPKAVSANELRVLSQKYADSFYKYFGPWIDVPAPDVNTDGQIMSWMLEAYENKVGHHAPATFTGKPLSLGGSLGREEATGQGGAFILKSYAVRHKLVPSKTTIGVQGFGNVGYWFANLARELKFKIVLVSDSSGGVYDPKGLDIDRVKSAKDSLGSLAQASRKLKLKFIPPEEVLFTKCDILVPAALENAITQKNAGKVNTKVILELANGPTTPEAEVMLTKKGVDIIPDILGNGGGVTVSYFEWVQNLHGYRWSKERINEELKVIMETAFEGVYALVKNTKTTYRKAAYMIAVKRVVDAMVLRGRV